MSDIQKLNYVEWLRRYILIHSYIYYELNNNVVGDKDYDRKAYELVEKQKTFVGQGMYGEIFKDFDGTTGFDLVSKLNEKELDIIVTLAYNIIRNYKLDQIKK